MNEYDITEDAVTADARISRKTRTHLSQGLGGKASASATGVGSCGDKLQVELCIEDCIIEDIRCHPQGCSYTAACAAVVTNLAQGRTLEAALQIQPENVECALGGLPEDHMHCARLAVNTLGEAIAEYYRRQMTSQKVGWKSW